MSATFVPWLLMWRVSYYSLNLRFVFIVIIRYISLSIPKLFSFSPIIIKSVTATILHTQPFINFKMQFTLSTLALLFASTGLVTAAPVLENRQFEAQITFSGAAGAEYSLSVPTLATLFTISKSSLSPYLLPMCKVVLMIVELANPLAVSKITSLGGASCTFFGSEGSVTTIVGARSADVGPPQPQVCLCFEWDNQRVNCADSEIGFGFLLEVLGGAK